MAPGARAATLALQATVNTFEVRTCFELASLQKASYDDKTGDTRHRRVARRPTLEFNGLSERMHLRVRMPFVVQNAACPAAKAWLVLIAYDARSSDAGSFSRAMEVNWHEAFFRPSRPNMTAFVLYMKAQ